MTRILLAMVLALASQLRAAPVYSFALHGEAEHPKILPVLSDRKGAPAPGDIGFVADIPFVLRAPGHYQFRVFHDNGEHLFCRIDDQPEFLAGVVIPFGPCELPAADWTLTTLTVRTLPGKPTSDPPPPSTATLPALPKDLRYLSIRCPGGASLHAAPLRRLPNLVYLALEADGTEFSLDHLGHAGQLRNLSIEGGVIRNPDVLRDLAELRFLKLRSVEGLETIAFAPALPELRVLKIDHTAVTDLRPLEGMQNLRLLSANGTQVDTLPNLSRLPALRDLRLHSTPVSNDKSVMTPLRSKTSILVKNWDPAIKAFEEHDAGQPPPERPLLFIGSSSIRMWDLGASFPGLPIMNRGFGGSELSDSLRYFDRIVLPYRPRAILLYAGDNDIGNGESPEQVVSDYQAFASKVRAHLPKTDFVYIPIKPSLKRWSQWPEMKRANEVIRKLAETDPRLHYLDTATPMLGADGTPQKDLFLDDGLHLNDKGYALWSEIVRPWLKAR